MELNSADNTGQWLHALPSPALRNNVNPELYRKMIQRRVRTPLFDQEFTCPLCDGVIDIYGDHCLVWAGGGDRTKRHNTLRNHVFHWSCSAGLNPELEKPGLLQPRPLQGPLPENGVPAGSDLRRPADVFLPRWRAGPPAALDFAVTSGLRPDMVQNSIQNATTAATTYEAFKCSHNQTELDCQSAGISFIPMVVEADSGCWGPSAARVFSELAKRKACVSGEFRNTTLMHLYQNLGISLHRENARAILRRMANYSDPRPLLAAATAAQC